MMIAIAVLNALLVVIAALGFAVCYRELRVLRRGLGALDEGAGRRTASIVVGLHALKEPLEAIRGGVEELSPNRRDTVEQRGPAAKTDRPAAGAAGLRVDVPKVGEEDRDSDGETRMMSAPSAETLKAPCRLCGGGGMVRARGGALETCGGCGGSGYIDPEGGRELGGGGVDERAARLPG